MHRSLFELRLMAVNFSICELLLDQLRQAEAANCAAYSVFHTNHQGCAQTPTPLDFVGVACSAIRRFNVLQGFSAAPAQEDSFFPSRRRKASRKVYCCGMSVALPPAEIYAHHTQEQITRLRWGKGAHMSMAGTVAPNTGVWFEVDKHVVGGTTQIQISDLVLGS